MSITLYNYTFFKNQSTFVLCKTTLKGTNSEYITYLHSVLGDVGRGTAFVRDVADHMWTAHVSMLRGSTTYQ